MRACPRPSQVSCWGPPSYCSESSCLPEGTAWTDTGSSCWITAVSLPQWAVHACRQVTVPWGCCRRGEVEGPGTVGVLYPWILTGTFALFLETSSCEMHWWLLHCTFGTYAFRYKRVLENSHLSTISLNWESVFMPFLGLQFLGSYLCLSKTSRSFSC